MSVKIIETVFEAVPGLVIQLFVFARASDKSRAAVFSILSSLASTAMTASAIFYDVDADPGIRRRNPKWIGMVPDQGRGEAFAAVFVLCGLQILAKSAATALLALANPTWLIIYFATDHGIHLAYRMARRDFNLYINLTPGMSHLTDDLKMGIFKCQRLLWEEDIGDQVRQFTMQNWARWTEEKPEWFTSLLISQVPDAYIPGGALRALGNNRERRGSAAGSMVRQSFRIEYKLR
ncbi:hypothetical protein TeGR_g1127 [Tetraparma gracilis]|uniref:Uncharacterized protein n=1 Tax=Tetraparma gracilis TaxID=2962635 RepID=A0ABQ6N9J6_9STRA|nr:hypothetical protein TeGR_g1127 [Tetraparma gracilis]